MSQQRKARESKRASRASRVYFLNPVPGRQGSAPWLRGEKRRGSRRARHRIKEINPARLTDAPGQKCPPPTKPWLYTRRKPTTRTDVLPDCLPSLCPKNLSLWTRGWLRYGCLPGALGGPGDCGGSCVTHLKGHQVGEGWFIQQPTWPPGEQPPPGPPLGCRKSNSVRVAP